MIAVASRFGGRVRWRDGSNRDSEPAQPITSYRCGGFGRVRVSVLLQRRAKTRRNRNGGDAHSRLDVFPQLGFLTIPMRYRLRTLLLILALGG